jgi:hypothetical protein
VELRLGAPVVGCLSQDLTYILAENSGYRVGILTMGQRKGRDIQEYLQAHVGELVFDVLSYQATACNYYICTHGSKMYSQRTSLP